MSDELPVPETLETIAAGIRDLRTHMDARFGKVDIRFKGIDKRFDEMKAQLQTEIESVRGDVRLVAEAFGTQTKRNRRNNANHKKFTKRLDEHDLRILALEPKKSSA